VSRTRKKRVLVGGVVLALAAGAGFVYLSGNGAGRDPADLIADHAPTDGGPLPAGQFLDGEEPTAVATDPAPSVGPTTDGALQVTFAAWDDAAGGVAVDGFLPAVVEETGTCTLTLTKDGDTATASVPGTASASTTACGGAVVPGSQLSTGTWTAVLTYRSPTSTGSSAPIEVAVP
jgi:hypothetical protein